MICDSCKEKRHEDCRGGSWCDCQHQTRTHTGPTTPDNEDKEEGAQEPRVNWLRQG
ncbi:hypothetical protein ABGB18_09915 [Nonomuraea sp. B12E4]|uniref:hypothetical protein n=1 Tax=Nonomuraea sp. B12E4 TaxID=3153564 RepID=UPI00325D4B2B